MIKTIMVLRREPLKSKLARAFCHDSRFQLVGKVESFRTMIEVASQSRIDYVVCDAVAGDMDFHECLTEMKKRNLVFVPRIVVICPMTTTNLFERFIELGASDVMQADMNVLFMLERIAADHQNIQEATYSGGTTAEISRRNIRSWLMLLEINPKLSAFRYITDAMILCGDDPRRLTNVTRRLYTAVAGGNGTRPMNVERAIRHGIEVMWRRASPRYINELFGNPYKAQGTKIPTNREFLAALYERLSAGDSIPEPRETLLAAEPPTEYRRE